MKENDTDQEHRFASSNFWVDVIKRSSNSKKEEKKEKNYKSK